MNSNDTYGNIKWNDVNNVQRQILTIPEMVSKDKNCQNATKNSNEQEVRTEGERACNMLSFLSLQIIWNCLSSSKTILRSKSVCSTLYLI